MSVLPALALASAAAAVDPFFVDIHIPVGGAAYDAALKGNAFLNAQLKSTDVDFKANDTPHVTLYLTEWSCPSGKASAADVGNIAPPPTCKESIALAISEVKYSLGAPFGPCELSLTNLYSQGNYIFANVSDTACLQRYSDTIVNASYRLATPNQPVPGWVNTLPEPERSEKTRYVKEFGSPNVFLQFQPHVTLAWGSDTVAVAAATAALDASGIMAPTQFSGDIVAMGSVGPHGTVLKDRDLAVFNVSVRKDHGCSRPYTDEKSCDADSLTDGGCVWCDIVDRSPFCTTDWNARSFEQQPPFQCNFRTAASPPAATAVVTGQASANFESEPAAACNATVQQGFKCPDTAYRRTQEASAADCCSTCAADSACHAFAYQSKSDESGTDAGSLAEGGEGLAAPPKVTGIPQGNCHLKHVVTSIVKAAGFTCGYFPGGFQPTPSAT